ncbi:thiamine-monophosphate kinase [Gordonia spumicola]|uniref:Thiamine-monophosphate kinase n=1 Tax=Gordonia spumicola TaxID=589161 RepID=A0A7I9VE62_9ACTN|nr:thiamine-phosphate kinase [Gordonia spumicola]GEE03575.1 thiamine-monophosphate kinase [Gordonia spumicola]
MTTVGEIGERELIARFTRAATRTRTDDVVIGSGDDAAVFLAQGPVVVSTDTAVAGRHFRFDWSTPDQIGARAVVQSAADIAAMGGRLTGVTVSIGCPPETAVDRLLALNAGIVGQTHAYDARVLGGDLVSSPTVVITVTAIGVLDDVAPATLAGARPGDVLAVSGPLGGAAAGLAVLAATEHGADPSLVVDHAEAVAAYRLPQPDLTAGPTAARTGVSAMTDVSDGLVEEIVTVAASSGVRLDVDSAAVPRADWLDAAGAALGVDPVRWALGGGEDHVLLATFTAGAVPAGWVVIGAVSEGSGAHVDGEPVGAVRGWQSFTET